MIHSHLNHYPYQDWNDFFGKPHQPARLVTTIPETAPAPMLETTTPVNTAAAIKHDELKPDLSLLSSVAILELAKVLDFGAKKYAAHNWRNGFTLNRPYSAAMRHMLAWNAGETTDPESGLNHLAHAMCNLMFLLELQQTHPELDNRYKPNV